MQKWNAQNNKSLRKKWPNTIVYSIIQEWIYSTSVNAFMHATCSDCKQEGLFTLPVFTETEVQKSLFSHFEINSVRLEYFGC